MTEDAGSGLPLTAEQLSELEAFGRRRAVAAPIS
jgi:hypothetical protein